MRIAILGAGAIARASAAYLLTRDHTPVIWSPSGKGADGYRDTPLVVEGEIRGDFRPEIAESAADAIAGADLILVALPANGHRLVYDHIARSATPEQPIVINAQPVLAGYALEARLRDEGKANPILVWGTTLLRCRAVGASGVRVNTIRKSVDMAMSASGTDAAVALCRAAFGDHFEMRPDMLSISLSNINPQAHLALALANFTRMERGEAWGQSENLTSGVARFLEKLDGERLALATKLGLTVRTMAEHYNRTYGFAIAPLETMAIAIRAEGAGQMGPTTEQSRYVLEDAPFGLAPLINLGRAAGVDMPLHHAGLTILSTLYGRDFAEENDLVGDVSGLVGKRLV
ncbi:MAG TPA: NAD/NADP octopine/nopaline dehydrogenase family protein [Pelagibacterium sp.]|uniref:NAD/NADP octopine/nopaline dehydrogenase family protein n=1 Tax=Pelagibacterium sp. TaxID=1967288 RepID=UPI002CA9902F|nr:NAD/NADP octopine/nopaline dehydrogenase family protein [Pelagibacterium sp.]HWJ87188.1 NAD/NADP octopine/nopaline dehydrogenase family protein [Pelagibacterium sp.]